MLFAFQKNWLSGLI